MEKLSGTSFNVVKDNIVRLKELFPEVFAENKIDFEKLQLVLGENIELSNERYSFNWKGKSDAIKLAQKQSTGTLRPCREESVNWDTTKNLYIEGDNLEVLRLLQNSYRNKVKMIYIDPPYNTGSDFVYKDDFRDNISNYKERMNESLKSNAETNGRYHTDWLNMMYPRLQIARNLLKEDGVIFISIDDNELTNMKKICDEVFGEESFIANIIWEKRITRENRRYVSVRHDYILMYAKTSSLITEIVGLLPMNQDAIDRYKNPDNDPRGVWTSVPAIAQGGHGTKSQFYTLTTPSGKIVDPPSGSCWRYTENRMYEEIKDNNIWFGKDGNGVPRIKKFLTEGRQGLTPETIWFAKEVETNDTAKRLLVELFDGISVFDTPKPIALIKQMLLIGCNDNGIVLDFFSGSSPTAQAVVQLNAEDGGNRKFIMVQIPEQTPENSEARKAGYETICQIGKERIRRAGKKILDENKDKDGIENLDIGFKVFKLDHTNLKIWDGNGENLKINMMDMVNPIKEDRSQEDVVYEILLKYGVDLTMPIEEININGYKVFSVGKGYLLICLENELSLELIQSLAERKPKRIVFYDKGFNTETVRINGEQILKKFDVEDIRVI